jgi:hypothetical protein
LCFDKFIKEESRENQLILLKDKAAFFCDSKYDPPTAIEACDEGLKLDPGNKFFLLKKA